MSGHFHVLACLLWTSSCVSRRRSTAVVRGLQPHPHFASSMVPRRNKLTAIPYSQASLLKFLSVEIHHRNVYYCHAFSTVYSLNASSSSVQRSISGMLFRCRLCSLTCLLSVPLVFWRDVQATARTRGTSTFTNSANQRSSTQVITRGQTTSPSDLFISVLTPCPSPRHRFLV